MIIYVTDSNVLRRNKRKGSENEIKTVDNGPLVFLTTELLDNLSQESRLDFYIFPLLLKNPETSCKKTSCLSVTFM